jgi:hypothetical protein
VSDCPPVLDREILFAETGEARRKAKEAAQRAEAERPKVTPQPEAFD